MDGRIEWLPPEDEPDEPGGRPPTAGGAAGAVDAVTAGRPDTARALAWERAKERVVGRLHAVPPRGRVAVAIAAILAASGVVAGYLATNGSSPALRAAPSAEEKFPAATSLLVAKALQPAMLGDVIRPTSQPQRCALVPPGRSPGLAVAAALGRVLPTYRLRDLGRILDQSTGLCALDLRAADTAGSVVLVEIVPPGTNRRRPYPQVSVSTLSDGRTSSSIASTVSVEGWSITVVAVGRLADQPDVAAMLSLTDDTSLRW